MPLPLEDLEAKLDYRFQRRDLLDRALTHRSASPGGPPDANNERQEFLGDAVLGLIACERLLALFPDASEGRLTKLKARLVSSRSLEEAAREIDLGRWLRLGQAEESSGGRKKRGLLVDALEAVFAAVYSDGGLEAARTLVLRLLLTDARVRTAEENLAVDNAKSTLQELLQSRALPLPAYRVLEEIGPPHQRRYRVAVEIGPNFRAESEADSKRSAEQKAAAQALEQQSQWLPSD